MRSKIRIRSAEQRARNLLQTHGTALSQLAEELILNETLEAHALQQKLRQVIPAADPAELEAVGMVE